MGGSRLPLQERALRAASARSGIDHDVPQSRGKGDQEVIFRGFAEEPTDSVAIPRINTGQRTSSVVLPRYPWVLRQSYVPLIPAPIRAKVIARPHAHLVIERPIRRRAKRECEAEVDEQ